MNGYEFLIAADQVVELRALGVANGQYRPVTLNGYFTGNRLEELATAAVKVQGAKGVYFTLNPLDPAVLARRTHRLARASDGDAAKDSDVGSRRWLLIDADPKRPTNISATDAEKAYAAKTIDTVRTFLHEQGWPEPIVSDSGNGYHLLYRIDLPRDDGGLVQRVLHTVADRFDTEHTQIDRSVHNPSRICKLPGTLAAKGDSTLDRPHRRSGVLSIPESMVIVSREQLQAVAASTAIPSRSTLPRSVVATRPSIVSTARRLDVAAWLTERGVRFRIKNQPDALNRTVYVLGNRSRG